MIDEVEQPGVCVLGVLDQQHDRVHLGQALEEQPPTSKQLLSGEASSGVVGDDHSEEPAEARTYVGLLRRVGHKDFETLGQLCRRHLGRVFLGYAQALAHNLGQGPKGHSLAIRQATSTMPVDAVGQTVDVLLELPAEP